MRLLFILVLLVSPVMVQQQIENPQQRLVELHKQWETDYSHASHVQTFDFNEFEGSVSDVWRRGRHELRRTIQILDSDLSLLPVGTSDLKPYFARSKALQVFTFCLTNPKYMATIQGNPKEGYVQEELFVRGTPQYREHVKYLKEHTAQHVARYGNPVVREPAFDHVVITSAVRNGAEEVFEYETKPEAPYWFKTKLIVRDGELVRKIGSSASVDELIEEPKGRHGTLLHRDGKLCGARAVLQSDDKLDTSECYLSYYGLPEPLSPGFVFRPWMIGAAGVALLIAGVGVQKLRGRPLWSR